MTKVQKQFKRSIRRIRRRGRKSMSPPLVKLSPKIDLITPLFDLFSLSKAQMKIIDALRIQTDITVRRIRFQ